MRKYVLIFVFLNQIGWALAIDYQDIKSYIEEREKVVLIDESLGFDTGLTLSIKEEEVNLHLSRLKKELLAKYRKEDFFPPAKNFLFEKEIIEKSSLYAFIQKMPKGGLLHVHSASLLQAKWLIKELTTLPDCYVYWLENGPILKGMLHFFKKEAVPEGFMSVAELRSSIPGFDQTLLSLLQVEKEDLKNFNLWAAFEGCFTRTKGLIHYKPAFIKYYKGSMESLIQDNLQYMELRALNTPVYNLDGTIEDPSSVIEAFLQVKKEIQEENPTFNFNIIYTEFRNTSKQQSLAQLEQAYFLRSLYPSFIIGYDLVGEEDTERTTLDYVETFLTARSFEDKYGVDMPYYFHTGESNWATNNNLYDAVLLKCKRIGHALNLFRYPYLIQKVKQENICIEVCPISNQVLGYVPDLRMHPASGYLKEGVPCVLASDDPGLFGYHGMSFDVWEAVMAWDLDLKAVKQLFINSLEYSGMALEEKNKAIWLWNEKWDAFIEQASLEIRIEV